jgi:phage baseplate assembly protein W
MFPKTQDLTVAVAEDTTVTDKSFLFDFTAGEFVIRDGKLVECDGIEAIKIWVEKILRTEKGRFAIYSGTDYGCHLEDLIVGSNFTAAFIESELRREVTDSLMQNPQIKNISNFEVIRGTNSITVSMEVSTVYDTGGNLITVAL